MLKEKSQFTDITKESLPGQMGKVTTYITDSSLTPGKIKPNMVYKGL